MRLASSFAAAAMSLGLVTGAAQAAPVASIQNAVDTGPAPQIQLVREGCGFGEHRGFYGRCRYNGGWRGADRFRHDRWRRWHHW